MAELSSISSLLVELPSRTDGPLHWWRVAEGELIAHGHDADVAAAAGERIIALLPIADAPLYTVPSPDLPVKQAEAVAARQLAARALGPSVHAVARLFADTKGDTAMQGATVDAARLRHGLSLLQERGLSAEAAVPAAMIARHIWWSSDTEAVQVVLMDETQWAGPQAVFPADTDLTRLLSPDVAPTVAGKDNVAAALVAIAADPAPNILTGAFALQRGGQGVSARQWRTIIFLLLAAMLVTLAIGFASWWRFAAAAEETDARALSAMAKALGPQNDLAAGESTLDARLAREGRGAAVMSAPLSTLYTAMQGAPQVNLRQLRYTNDGTMMATMAAPTSDAANAVLARLQQDGYKVSATARTDDSGAQVVDVTIRGY